MVPKAKALHLLRVKVGGLHRCYNFTKRMVAKGKYGDNEHTRSFKRQYVEAAQALVNYAYAVRIIDLAQLGKMMWRISEWRK